MKQSKYPKRGHLQFAQTSCTGVSLEGYAGESVPDLTSEISQLSLWFTALKVIKRYFSPCPRSRFYKLSKLSLDEAKAGAVASPRGWESG